ncbi:MAG: DUF3822 family protein [Bacteroidetes bacterium]|nr:DUF3822 family protein [Bacteroidota bacterium]
MLTETNSLISQALSLVDDLFDGRQTKGYHLAIQLSSDGLSAAVWDDVYNKALALERFSFQKAFNVNTLLSHSNSAIKQSSILCYPYKKVSLSIVNTRSTLVPNALFDANEKDALLKFNHSLADSETIVIDNLPNLDAKNIYALPKVIEQQFRELYTQLDITHYSSPLIEHVLLTNKHSDTTNVVLNVHSEGFEVLVLNSGKLLFYNTFSYQTAEDFIYYLLFVFEQLKLNPESVKVELLGELEKNSAIYQLLYKYIRNIKFGDRPDAFDYSFKITALPKQYYYSLFSQFLYP